MSTHCGKARRAGEATEEKFEVVPGLTGRVFVPEGGRLRKHPCPECYACQWCPDARCAACREGCQRKDLAAKGET